MLDAGPSAPAPGGGLVAHLSAWLRTRHPREVSDPDLIGAAVALIVAPDPDAFVLIRRAARGGDPWSGQMALPGGRHDPADDDLLATARREVAEEIGLDLSSATLLGALDDIAPRSPHLPPLMVRPYVFAIPGRVQLQSSSEVEQALWTPFATLSAAGVYRDVRLDLKGRSRVFPAYHLPEGVVWGMTERILTPVLRSMGRIP